MPNTPDRLELSAPAFVLTLLDSAPDAEIRVASLVAAAGAFQIDPGAVRVALARLVKQGILTSAGRGSYRVGRSGLPMQRAVVSWATAEASLKAWDGRWLAVFTAHLNRTDKTAVRAAERALRLKGFRSADAGLAVRPANLRAPLDAVHAELKALGLNSTARLIVIEEMVPPANFAKLWERALLEACYRHHLSAMAQSTARLKNLNAIDAAKETLLIGRAVTRDIVLDPLLPEQLVDSRLRHQMISAMEHYDRLGKRSWREFYAAI